MSTSGWKLDSPFFCIDERDFYLWMEIGYSSSFYLFLLEADSVLQLGFSQFLATLIPAAKVSSS